MRMNGCTATVLSLTMFSAVALADDYPPRKPGLWELAVQREGRPVTTMKMCIDPDTDQLFHKFGTDMAAKHCTRNDIKVSGAIVTTESECKIGNTTITTTAVINFTGDSAYHSDVKTHIDPPVLGKTDATLTQDGKWTGPCPPDMKPGDFVMANGMKINVKTLNELRQLIPGNKPAP
ncbi:MAG TPA: DUF3617 family protein [Methylovirgula sp.]|nr:DUF3617 family protein [Methylovirgula sp.]